MAVLLIQNNNEAGVEDKLTPAIYFIKNKPYKGGVYTTIDRHLRKYSQ
jgi:hypothetical protein